MKVQESSFKSMFESLLSSLTNRVDILTETVAGIKANLDWCLNQTNDLTKSVEFTQDEVQGLKSVVSKLFEAEKEISLIRNSITLHQNKLEALENHSRRKFAMAQPIRLQYLH